MSRIIAWGALFVAGMSSLPVKASDLDEYTGTGTVYVHEDGRVFIVYASPAQDADWLVIDDATDHYLISDGTTATLLPPGQATPPGTKTKTKLDGTGCNAIGQFYGTLSVVDNGNDCWSITVVGGSLATSFSYDFTDVGTLTDGDYCCEQTCPNQSHCSVSSNYLFCACFCDLFGNAACVGFVRLQVVVSVWPQESA